MTFPKVCALWLAFLVFPYLTVAQMAAPTANVLTRTVMVESSHGRASTFSIDVDGREYWITAKHLLTGAKNPPYGSVPYKSVSLKILDPNADQGEHWLTLKFSVIDAGRDIDIVVLAPPNPLLTSPVPSLPTDSVGLSFGGDCEFLGFPYGGGWRAPLSAGHWFWVPFVKHCGVSAMTSTAEPKIWVLDGINNEGFSGGPVIFRTGPQQRLFAVISGYYLEPAEIVSSATVKNAPAKKSAGPKKAGANLHANVNSGFIIAYDISYAVNAIRQNPIGALRAAK